MNPLTVTIGSDPEVFLEDSTGVVASQSADVPGSKDRPYQLKVGAVHRDNVLMELNVPPGRTRKEFLENTSATLQYAMLEVSNNYKISQLASTYMHRDELWHPEAMVFGCSSDFNAWKDGAQNPAPKDKEGFRTAGGHIHVGWEDPCKEDRIDLIRLMDLYLGVPSLFMDKDTERRQLYGKAGCFRPKEYGVEYRTLSNFWMFNGLMEWAYDNTQRAIASVGRVDTSELSIVEDVINTCNLSEAESLINFYDLEVRSV